VSTILTLPEVPGHALSIRAKAFLFHDPASLALLHHLERVARSDATVLIIGETGTGKELIARHVHKQSGRAGPFVAVNCGAFSDTLIDAELFGNEVGAYTGAVRARPGWFETANGGTLFLDEIGDLSPSLQVKLLRVLQERQVVRLGSTRPLPLDVRLVAATNVDLAEAVRAQHFRADLFYRLSVASIAVPPLRERRGDILPLAAHFVGVYGPRLNSRSVRFSPAAEDALLSYPWPGNIRELENTVHHALIVCRDEVIHDADLRLAAPMLDRVAGPATLERADVPPGRHEPARDPRFLHDEDYPRLRSVLQALLARGEPDLLRRVEAELVRTVYACSKENQVRAAKALGITRNSMRTLLKRHQLIDDAAAGLPSHGDRGDVHPGDSLRLDDAVPMGDSLHRGDVEPLSGLAS